MSATLKMKTMGAVTAAIWTGLALGGCVGREEPAGPVEGPSAGGVACGKCDGLEGAVTLDPALPGEAAVLRLAADALRGDGIIDAEEAWRIAAFTRKDGGRSERVVAWIKDLLASDAAFEDAARDVLIMAASRDRVADIPLSNEVYEVVTGTQDFLFDDKLILKADGVIEGETGLVSHSRGYAAKRDGVLFKRHGSPAPHHALSSTPQETEWLRQQGPDAALDRAAHIGGLELDDFNTFSKIARDPNYYDPGSSTPFWAGICQGWTHNALDNRLSALVDVEGPQGARGVWIFGQWISRADLGNAMMGASYSLGIADSVTIDSFVTPESLIKALAQHVLRSGRGLRVDIWNDEHNDSGTYNPQIWNQPVLGGSVEVASVSEETAAAILAHAAADPRLSALPADADVRLVHARATWGVEANDAWEGEALVKESLWTMYMVTDAQGVVLKGYMAPELAARNVAPLPFTDSDGLPDYMAIPRHALTDAAFEGAPHRLLDPSNPEGARFRFLVGTVLARGIPNHTRAAFEAEALAPDAKPEALAARYPGVANAYTPEAWAQLFAPTLGPGASFGAVWASGR